MNNTSLAVLSFSKTKAKNRWAQTTPCSNVIAGKAIFMAFFAISLRSFLIV